MAKQVINIGTTANDGTGDPLRSAFDKVNDNFTELYDDDAGDVNSITATAPIVRDSPTGNVTISLADNGITYAKLGTEFTTSAAVSALAVDFATAQVFTKTVSANPSAFTFSNASVGMVKDLVVTGNVVISFPTGTKIVAGTYDGTVSNLIQIVVAGTGDYWVSISKAQ
tara:strand:- start:17 stop:523 length:507 start_codon:yes stop_codon:yes gene_type:complete